MDKREIYEQLQELKRNGLTRTQASARLQINYRTANRYWDMSREDFEQFMSPADTRFKTNSQYHDDILRCLRRFPEMSAQQIHDWICMERDVKELEGTFRCRMTKLSYNTFAHLYES